VLSYGLGHPQESVGDLYKYNTWRELKDREGGEPFRKGKGLGGPEPYDSTETLVLLNCILPLGEESNKLITTKQYGESSREEL
jgi:hypothetical protein